MVCMTAVSTRYITRRAMKPSACSSRITPDDATNDSSHWPRNTDALASSAICSQPDMYIPMSRYDSPCSICMPRYDVEMTRYMTKEAFSLHSLLALLRSDMTIAVVEVGK